MKKMYYLIYLFFLLFNNIFIQVSSNLTKESLKEGIIYLINENISGSDEYKTKTVFFGTSDIINYLTYDFGSSLPSSLITSFRLNITPFWPTILDTKILCANVPSTTTDSELKNIINEVKRHETKSTCLHISQNEGVFDTLMKLDASKSKIVIGIYIPGSVKAYAKINFRIKERILLTNESTPTIVDLYSIIPVSIDTQLFRNSVKKASKILFYSNKYNLYMYEPVSSNKPVLLFSGNIINVYTGPEMIKQKYHGSSIMTLLATRNQKSNKNDLLGVSYTYQVICLELSFLLDYYVSSNPSGREVNSPLLINMPNCSTPYYVILNYNNAKDSSKTLILDKIYGKISLFGIATSFTQDFWDNMIQYDIKSVNINDKKYALPFNSESHIDVYKIQCSLPLMLNFYYIDESIQQSKLDEGFNQEIIIKPLLKGNDNKIILPEENNNVVSIPENNELSLILTHPKALNNYVSIECCLCTKKSNAYIQLFNTYNNYNLGYDNQINNSIKFITIENIEYDIEFKITKAKNGDEVFIKYSGVSLNTKRNALPNAIKIKYDRDSKILSWVQPLQDQIFTYTIFFDKIDTMKPKYYTLCNTTSGSILGSIKKVITTDSREPNIIIETDAPEVKNLGEFDVVIIAEEIGGFKITIISATYDSFGGNNEEDPNNKIIGDNNDKTVFIIILIISAAIVIGIIVLIFIICKYKKKEQFIKDEEQSSILLHSLIEDKLVNSEQSDSFSQIEEHNQFIGEPNKEKEKNNIINIKHIREGENDTNSLVKENETDTIIDINNNQKKIMNDNNLENDDPPSKNKIDNRNQNQNINENQSLENNIDKIKEENKKEEKHKNISDEMEKDENKQNKDKNNNQASSDNNLNNNIASKNKIEKIKLLKDIRKENINTEQIKTEPEKILKNDETTEDDDFPEDLQIEEPPHLDLSEDNDWD